MNLTNKANCKNCGNEVIDWIDGDPKVCINCETSRDTLLRQVNHNEKEIKENKAKGKTFCEKCGKWKKLKDCKHIEHPTDEIYVCYKCLNTNY